MNFTERLRKNSNEVNEQIKIPKQEIEVFNNISDFVDELAEEEKKLYGTALYFKEGTKTLIAERYFKKQIRAI